MPSFVFNGKLLDISVSYDGVSIYPNFSMEKLIEAKLSCEQLAVVQLPPKDREEKVSKDFKESGYDRSIFRDNDDHEIYHQDGIDRNREHYHIKFKSHIDAANLSNILDVLIKYGFFYQEEKESCLASLEKHFNDIQKLLKEQLIAEKTADLPKIIQFIANLKDNDLLANLHLFLLSEKFNYLREKTGNTSISFWQGTNAKGEVVSTSKSWAMIEKAFMLQMAKNIKTLCSKFTKAIAEERAAEFSAAHAFFKIKRNTLSFTRSTSESYDNFLVHEETKFDERHKAHFVAYGKK